MPLEINNDRADELAVELSELTGESIDNAVTRALEERLERERKLRGVASCEEKPLSAEEQRSIEERVAEAMAIVRAAGGKGSGHSSDHDELLYDERGLPREW
jgi:hypothetical protein